ncbi:MAG TPA: ABC transporter transmembrane domain-containing protein, partial [Burkholderiales bacterium]|nr:ABC transporter transmembrane domain-containing protein [Burkholderiales bacterium]
MTTPSSRELYFRLLGYVRPYSKVFGLAILAMVCAAATEPLLPALIKPLLDGGFARGEPTWPPLAFGAAIIGVFMLRGIFTFTSSYCLAWVANRVVLDLRAAMFARLVRMPAKYFDDNTSGALLSKVAYDVSGVTGAATTALTVIVRDSIAVVGLLAWLFYLNWKLTLIVLVIGPPVAFTVQLTSRRLRRMARGVMSSLGEVVHVLQETIDCHKVVKVFGGQDYESKRFHDRVQVLRGFIMRAEVPAALTTPITHTLAAFALAVIIYISMQDTLASRATVGEFASFMTAMLMLLAPLKHLTEINNALQRGLASAESVFAMIDAPVEVDTGKVALGRARGEVVYEKVGLVYPTRTEPALA